jgi:hypothetical protein
MYLHTSGDERIANGNGDRQVSSQPELDYLKAVNGVAPPQDPQLLFLLMGAFSNANRPGEGAEFLAARMNEFDARLNDPQKALYLSAIGMLRAQHASSVALLRRIGNVKETIAMLDEAKTLSGGQIFVVNWISGVVRTELPAFFHQKQAALDSLRWCEANIAKAPHIGWLREVNFRLGKLLLDDGDRAGAQEYLEKSGYKSFDKVVVLNTPFSRESLSGHAFSSRRIFEVVPGRVYTLRFRVHRIPLCRLRRWNAVDRHRRRDPNRFRTGCL